MVHQKDSGLAIEKEYYSAEFQLKKEEILYQFKIRKNKEEPLFAVVKEGSKALDELKEGDTIDMTYYFQDNLAPAEKRITRIKYISHNQALGFKGHYMVALDIDSLEKELKAV